MRILFLQKRLLFPANSGGKIRTLNVLKHLAQRHKITYLCNVQQNELPYLGQMEALGLHMQTVPWSESPRRSFRFACQAIRNLLSSTFPLNVDKDFDAKLRARALQLVSEQNFDLLVCDFVQMARNCLGIDIPKLLFQHNVESEIFVRIAQRSSGIFRNYLSSQARRMSKFEGRAGKDFDTIVAVSERDQHHFQSEYGWNNVDIIDTAVDLEYFRPRQSSPRNGIVFVGSMDWMPNIDGVTHFLENVWPHLKRALPDTTFTIVGRNPTDLIRGHNGRNGVSVTGTVDDVRPYLESAAVSIVPLYSGGGTRLKILESMAMCCPVVSTTLGAEGLSIRDNEHLLIRDSDEHLHLALLQLLQDRPQQEQLAQTAFQLVSSRFGAENIAAQFESSCEQAVSIWKKNRG